jgi:hypothetical protein
MAATQEFGTLFEAQLISPDIEAHARYGPAELGIRNDVFDVISPVIDSLHLADRYRRPETVTQLDRENIEKTFQVETFRQAVSVLAGDPVRRRQATGSWGTGEKWERVTTLSGNSEDGYELHSSVRLGEDGEHGNIETFFIQSGGEEIVRINASLTGQTYNAELRLRERGSLAAQTGGSYHLRVNYFDKPSVTIVGRETSQGQFERADVTVSSAFRPRQPSAH